MIVLPLPHILIFSLLLFAIGVYGALVRRNIIGILISIELMLNAANINLIAFSKLTSNSGLQLFWTSQKFPHLSLLQCLPQHVPLDGQLTSSSRSALVV
jgi:multisubunit Na+/H+ antiporter MnhC subunit